MTFSTDCKDCLRNLNHRQKGGLHGQHPRSAQAKPPLLLISDDLGREVYSFRGDAHRARVKLSRIAKMKPFW
jgi:hypothetical protein